MYVIIRSAFLSLYALYIRTYYECDIFSARCDYKSSQSLQSLPGWQEKTFGIALSDDNFMIGVDIT